MGNLAIYYEDFGYSEGLITLGDRIPVTSGRIHAFGTVFSRSPCESRAADEREQTHAARLAAVAAAARHGRFVIIACVEPIVSTASSLSERKSSTARHTPSDWL